MLTIELQTGKTISDWITENYNKLNEITKKVSKLECAHDLLHLSLEQLLLNKNFNNVPEKEKLFFFTKIVRNNYYSESSPYYHTYTKYQFNEWKEHDEQDQEYQEDPIDLDWVNNHLNEMKKGNDWYYAKLFQLYIEEDCSITKLSKRSTIPVNSVSRDINKMRKKLIELRKKVRDN